MHLAKSDLQKKKEAAVYIQKMTRGAIQRPIYKQLKVEAAEEARVNSKLAALQKRLADAEMKWIQADKARIEAEKKAAAYGEKNRHCVLCLSTHHPAFKSLSIDCSLVCNATYVCM